MSRPSRMDGLGRGSYRNPWFAADEVTVVGPSAGSDQSRIVVHSCPSRRDRPPDEPGCATGIRSPSMAIGSMRRKLGIRPDPRAPDRLPTPAMGDQERRRSLVLHQAGGSPSLPAPGRRRSIAVSLPPRVHQRLDIGSVSARLEGTRIRDPVCGRGHPRAGRRAERRQCGRGPLAPGVVMAGAGSLQRSPSARIGRTSPPAMDLRSSLRRQSWFPLVDRSQSRRERCIVALLPSSNCWW